MHKIKKYWPFFKAGMMETVAHKANIYSWMIVTILQLACTVFLWVTVYANSQTGILHGFTFQNSICYFICINIYAFSVLGSDTLYMISEDIHKGTIALSFTKPISYRWKFLFYSMGNNFTGSLILGIPTMIIAFVIFNFTGLFKIESAGMFLIHVLIFLIDTILVISLYDVMEYICGVLCFYTNNAWGLSMVKDVVINFFSGVMLPIAFFPESFGKIISILPFAGLGQNPILILLQMVDLKTSVLFTLKNLAWWLSFEIVAWLFFKIASKKVTVQGG